MKLTPKSGAAIAAAAAALISTSMVAPVAFAESDDVVKCYGVNACKGTSACATGKSECKGHNNCKGEGFLEIKKSECLEKKGSLTPS